MLCVKDIKSMFQAVGISTHETVYNFDSEVDIRLKSDDIEELVDIAVENDVKTAFYSYLYADADDYLIVNEDMLDQEVCEDKGLDYDRYCTLFNDAKLKFNSIIDQSIFGLPFMLCVYCLIGNIQVGIIQSDERILDLPDKEVATDGIIEKLKTEKHEALSKKRENDAALRLKMKNDLVSYLDRTDEWYDCTNQRLRRNYCQALIERYKEEHDLKDFNFYWTDLVDEMEIRWNKYKRSGQRS